MDAAGQTTPRTVDSGARRRPRRNSARVRGGGATVGRRSPFETRRRGRGRRERGRDAERHPHSSRVTNSEAAGCTSSADDQAGIDRLSIDRAIDGCGEELLRVRNPSGDDVVLSGGVGSAALPGNRLHLLLSQPVLSRYVLDCLCCNLRRNSLPFSKSPHLWSERVGTVARQRVDSTACESTDRFGV